MSDAVRDLTIRILLDKSKALAESASFFEAERKQVKRSLTDAEVAERAKTAFMRREIRQRIQAAAQAQKTTIELEREAVKNKQQAERDKTKAERDAERERKRIEAERRKAEREAVAAMKRASAERSAILKAERKNATDEIAAVKYGLNAANVAVVSMTGAATAMMRGLAASSQEATAYIKNMVTQAEAARSALSEIAALTGNKQDIKFTAQQAQQAARAGVSPEAFAQAQTRWEQYAGQFIGNGPEHKLTRDQSDDLLRQATTYSAARGIDSGDTAQLLATIVSAMPKGANNKDVMTEFAKAQKVAELAAGPTGPIVRQIAELANQEVTAGGSIGSVHEAAPFIAAAAQQDAGSAGMLTQAMLRGLREVRKDPAKMKALGITGGMNIMQQLGAINSAAEAHVSAGGDEGQFLDRFFTDSREWRGIRGMLNAGIRGGGFARNQAQVDSVGADTVAAANQDYLGGEQGRFQTRESELAAAQRARASKFVRLREIELEERRKLADSGELERPQGPIERTTSTFKWLFNAGDREQQLLTSRMGQRLQDELMKTDEGVAYGRSHHLFGDGPQAVGQLGGAFTPTQALAEGFNFVDELNRNMKALGDASAKAAKALDAINKPPVPAPAPSRPPAGPGRAGG